MTPHGIVVVGYVLIALFLWPSPFIALPATSQDPSPLRVFYINNQAACSDAAGAGTLEKPYCTLRYVATWWRPGDMFMLGNSSAVTPYRDCSGPAEFTRGGTAAAPITVRGVGDHPVISACVDVKDEDFVPVATMPGVFRLPVAAGAVNGVVWQTHFPDILVDDPNASKYTMRSADGPLQLVTAPDDATLAKVEGTYRYSSTDGMRVHPYGSQPPSVSSSDLVIGTGRALNFASNLIGMRFENLTITYSGSVYTAAIQGTGHVFRDIRWVGVPVTLRGTGHVVENFSVTHVHFRDASGGWTWFDKGNGVAGTVSGWNHRLTNGHIFHNWNTFIGTETGNKTTFDGFRVHGAPNHCGLGVTGSSTIRNAVMWNCQDYQQLEDTRDMVLEHVVLAGNGIAISAVDAALGPLTVRNSILRGQFRYNVGTAARCTYEKGSLLENSIVDTSASIERCADMKIYPLQEYIDKCANGTFPAADCMTIRNVKIIPFAEWGTVLKDGMWSGGDTWDVSLVPGSPAINIGASTTLFDILRVPRPQPANGLSDAGIFEVAADVVPPAAQGAPIVTRK